MIAVNFRLFLNLDSSSLHKSGHLSQDWLTFLVGIFLAFEEWRCPRYFPIHRDNRRNQAYRQGLIFVHAGEHHTP